MTGHPNLDLVQRGWDALAQGDPAPAFAQLADDVVVENGPLPAPDRWRVAAGKEAFATMLMQDARRHHAVQLGRPGRPDVVRQADVERVHEFLSR
jgi:ketosteroid isomerase-like protein